MTKTRLGTVRDENQGDRTAFFVDNGPDKPVQIEVTNDGSYTDEKEFLIMYGIYGVDRLVLDANVSTEIFQRLRDFFPSYDQFCEHGEFDE